MVDEAGVGPGAEREPIVAGSRVPGVRRLVYWLVVVASAGWTMANWGGLAEALGRSGSVGPLIGVLSALAVLQAVGVALVCFCVAERTALSVVRDPLRWVRSFRDIRQESVAVLNHLATSRTFLLGWWGSWLATTVASVIPACAAVVLFGSSGLGVVGLAAVSIAVNLSWRLPIEIRLRRLRASTRGVIGPAASW